MRKIVLGACLLGIATACPKVERKVYSFDVKAKTGTLVFENIVTDTPETQNGDFMQIVNEVVRGSKIEEQNIGWRIHKKELYENAGRLDGKMEFTFDDAEKAGLYKHDKKSPYIWCASRDEEETIISTNGVRLDATLPGCVAWDRKATKLEVTVRAATFAGGEQNLVGPYTKWAAGEELEIEETDGGGMFGGDGSMDGLGDIFAGGIAGGIADAMAGDAKMTIGPAVGKGGTDVEAAAALGPLQESMFKMCLSVSAMEGRAITETLAIEVRPNGTYEGKVIDSSAPDAEREKCYLEALTDVKLSHHDKVWTIHIPMSLEMPSAQ